MGSTPHRHHVRAVARRGLHRSQAAVASESSSAGRCVEIVSVVDDFKWPTDCATSNIGRPAAVMRLAYVWRTAWNLSAAVRLRRYCQAVRSSSASLSWPERVVGGPHGLNGGLAFTRRRSWCLTLSLVPMYSLVASGKKRDAGGCTERRTDGEVDPLATRRGWRLLSGVGAWCELRSLKTSRSSTHRAPF